MSPKTRWIVSQVGAREHYAVPRAFHQEGQLRHLYTDQWFPGIRWQFWMPLRRLAGRYHESLCDAPVTAFNLPAIGWELRKHLNRSAGSSTRFLRHGRWFARKVADQLKTQHLDPARDAFFGFHMASLETLQLLRDHGIVTVVDEADPGRTEDELVAEEIARRPDWTLESHTCRSDAYHQRRMAECEAATIVLVNSPWSRQAMIQQGVPDGKIIVLPLAYENPRPDISPKSPPQRPLQVLWIGSAILRKGIAYLIEAAKLLENTGIRFKVVGMIGITDQAIQSAPSNIDFAGHIPRSETEKMYRDADVFVIPTLSDGFAITQLEAMSFGLPVIATDHCGQVVTDGQDGLIVPAADAQALAGAISKLNDDRQLIAEMSRHAIEKSKQFTLARYANSVNHAVRSVLDQRAGGSGEAVEEPSVS